MATAMAPPPIGVIENPLPEDLGVLATIDLRDESCTNFTDANVALPSDISYGLGLGTIRESIFSCFKPVWGYFGPRKDFVSDTSNSHEIAFEDISDLNWIGSGSQGIVFSGIYKNKMVAVKKVTMLKDSEVKNLRQLKHENIIDFIGVCSKKPCYCIVMEYCSKGQLCEVLKDNAIGKETWLSYAKGIAEGMKYLHENDVIHRDLKGPNILINENNTVKICDFGTSRHHGKSNSTNMSFCGTVSWMAPEMLRNQKCSTKVDVYSFGVVLWEMVTRVAPFKDIAQPAIIFGVGTKKLSLPIPKSIPGGLNLLMIQCWSLKPVNRPSFTYIVKLLGQLALEFGQIDDKDWAIRYQEWKEFGQKIDYPEVDKEKNNKHDSNDCVCKDRLRHIRDIRDHYEEKLKRTNRMFDKMSKCVDSLTRKEIELKRWEASLAAREAIVTKLTARTTDYHNQHFFASETPVRSEMLSNMPSSHRRREYRSDSSDDEYFAQRSCAQIRRYPTEPSDLGYSPRGPHRLDDSPGAWSAVRGTPNRSSGISQDSGHISAAPSVQNVSVGLGEHVAFTQKLYRNAEGRWSDGRIAQRRKPRSREGSFHRDSPARMPHVRSSNSQKSSPMNYPEAAVRSQRAKSMTVRRSTTPYDNMEDENEPEPMDVASPEDHERSLPTSTSYSEALKSCHNQEEDDDIYLQSILPNVGLPINVMEASDELNSSMDSRTNGDASAETSSDEELEDDNGNSNGLSTSMDSRSSADDFFKARKRTSGSQSTLVSSLELSLERGATKSDGLSDKEMKIRAVKNSIRAHRRTPSNPTAMSAIQDKTTSQSSSDCEDVEV